MASIQHLHHKAKPKRFNFYQSFFSQPSCYLTGSTLCTINRAYYQILIPGKKIKKKKTGSSSYLEPREILFWIANRASQEKSLHSATSK
jgi:hypothetical protein